MHINMIQAQYGDDSLDSKAHASSKTVPLQACRDWEICMNSLLVCKPGQP